MENRTKVRNKRQGIQVSKLLQRHGDQANRLKQILAKKEKKKNRNRRRVAEYQKYLAKLRKEGKLQEYSLEDVYSKEETKDENSNSTKQQVLSRKERNDEERKGDNEQKEITIEKQRAAVATLQEPQIAFKEKEKRLKKRKEKHKNMLKRTQRGQPIMRYRINNIVEKLSQQG